VFFNKTTKNTLKLVITTTKFTSKLAISAARKTGFFIRAAFQPLVESGSNKKALDFV
jgi:hypothetical protein